MTTVLKFKPDGTATGLYTEAIPLADLGTLKIARASTIEFDDFTQLWEVKIVDQSQRVDWTHTAFRSPSREECLEWEHTYFNDALLRQ